jgi:hypothetical protein
MGAKARVNTYTQTNTNNRQVVNITAISEDIFNSVRENISSSAANCSQSTTLAQEIKFSGITANVVNITNLSQTQSAKIDFNCSAIQNSSRKIKEDISSNISNALSTQQGADLLSKLKTDASAAVEGTNMGGDVNVSATTISKTTTDSEFKQMVTNTIDRNITDIVNSEKIANCTSDFTAFQRMIFQDFNVNCDNVPVGMECGTFTVDNLKQEQQVENFTSCIIDQSSIEEAMAAAATEFCLTSQTEQTTKATTETDTKASAAATGVFSELGGAISGIVDSVGNAISGIFGAAGSFWIIIILLGAAAAYFFGPTLLKKFLPSASLGESSSSATATTTVTDATTTVAPATTTVAPANEVAAPANVRVQILQGTEGAARTQGGAAEIRRILKSISRYNYNNL